MFLGYYELDGEQHFDIYIGGNDLSLWNRKTWSPLCKNIKLLSLEIKGKTYQDKKQQLRDLAIEWQHNFSEYNWSYGELAEIQDYFYTKGKKYGLLKEFKENCIC